MDSFDRLKDWQEFNDHMIEYLKRPQEKYSGKAQLPDLLHFTGLRISMWNIMKYIWRLWLGSGKEHDFEKIAHYDQIAWTETQRKRLKAPFIKSDINEEFIIVRSLLTPISEMSMANLLFNVMKKIGMVKEENCDLSKLISIAENYIDKMKTNMPKCKLCGADGVLTNKDSYYIMMCMNQNCKNITNSYIDKNDAIDAWINEYSIK